MLNQEFQKQICDLLDQRITNIFPVSGGDISLAYHVKTEANAYFLKVNKGKEAFKMFQTEKAGLEIIARTQTISVPKVYGCDAFENETFLLMEFIECKSPSSLDFQNLGLKLAELHRQTNDNFGLDFNNYIGSLHQSNSFNSSWVDFYTSERLLPQIKIAKEHGLLAKNECPSESILFENLDNLFSNIYPSLLHGDLWSGNYLISTDGVPYLIDPAIYYGHNEVDIAMSKLFDGFGDDFYEAYYSLLPNDSKTESRIEIYQLYYLLVHLNLFGRSYYSSVIQILNKHFK